MTDRFNPGRVGDWVVFCDICGQKCYASEATRLPAATGRGGLIVCPKDVDKIDYGLIPYKTPTERNVPWTRINHTNTDNGSPVFDLESATVEQISSYQYVELSQGNDVILTLSQDEDTWIATSQEL